MTVPALSRSTTWRLLLAALVGCTPTLLAQVRDSVARPTAPPILITGQVIAGDADAEAPVPRVRVSVQGSDTSTVQTNAEGRFQLLLPEGTGGVRLSKNGFAPVFVERGALRSGTQLMVRLAKGGAINGVVVDQSGAPAVNVPVRVRRVFESNPTPGGGTQFAAETDDLGEFRVGNLPAGRYTLAAGIGGRGGGRGGGGDIAATLDLLGGRGGLRDLIDNGGGGRGNIRDLLEPVLRGNQGGQANGAGQPDGVRGRAGNGRGRANGAQPNGAPQDGARAAQADPSAAGGQNPGDGRGRGGRGGRGRGPDPADQGLPTIEVAAGQDSAITLAYESPSLEGVVQAITNAQRALAPSTVNGVVRGRVLSAEGRPVKSATVQLNPVGSGTRRAAVTDAEGRYEMTGVTAGSYRAHVTKSGLPEIEYGQARTMQAGRVINVGTNARVEGIDVSLPRSSVVTGAVTDAWGDPMEGVNLQVWQASYVEGRTTLAAAAGVRARRSDDRGRFRLFGLLPGTYYLVASDGPERGDRGPDNELQGVRVFYPGTLNLSSATPVTIEPGQDAGGIDFSFNSQRASQVKGVATNSQGGPARGRALLAVSQRSGEPLLPLQTAPIDETGSFMFNGVAAGDYVVQIISNAGPFADGGRGGRGGFDGGGRGRNGGGGGAAQGGAAPGAGAGRNGGGGGGVTGGAAGAAGATGATGAAAAQAAGRQGAGSTQQQARGGSGGNRGAAVTQQGGQRGRGQGNTNAGRANRPSDREFGTTYVTVNEGEVASVQIETSPGTFVSGQVVLEGDASNVSPSSFAFTAYPTNADTSPLAGTRSARADVSSDGTFAFDQVIGANRIAMTRAPDGWWLKSAYVNGVNAVDDPVVFTRGDAGISGVTVTFASGAGTIEGRVLDDRRQPTGEFAVVVFAPDPAKWFSHSPYLRFGTPSQEGAFSVSGLPPGEYLVAALDRIEGGTDFGDWQNPNVLSALAATARRLKVGAGQVASAELRMLRMPR